ncbi:MAG: site-specific integrase [bacterium]|nr:site-specific integrase [bacterium]
MAQIINRGKNIWLVRIYMGKDSTTGKKIFNNKTIYGTKKDANTYITDVSHQVNTGTYIQPSKQTLTEYLNNWLDTAAKPRVSLKTFVGYDNMLRTHIMPVIGHYQLAQLTPLDIQKVFNAMQARGLTRSTEYTRTVLRNALQQAVKWGMLPRNPAQDIEIAPRRKREMSVLTKDEAIKLLEASKDNKWGLLFELLLVTGLRPGEALGLKWGDIVDGKISIQRTLVRVKDTCELKEPKTPRSRRVVPLPSSTGKALLIYRKQQIEKRLAATQYNNMDMIFASDTGEPLYEEHILKRFFRPLLEKAGLPKIRLYDLRHTCATLLLAAGTNPKIVSERLGHASIILTLDTYSHVLPDMQQGATDILERVLYSQEI